VNARLSGEIAGSTNTRESRELLNFLSSWPGVVPAIHASPQHELMQNCLSRPGVDARDKPGHDVLGLKSRREKQPKLFPRPAAP
jgi:hypothetical protein